MNPLKIRRLTDIQPWEEASRRSVRAKLNQEEFHLEACKVCPKPIWFTAFFDGTGNNFDEDGAGVKDVTKVKYSNISKLAQFAHVAKGEIPRTHSVYIQGVGTPYGEVGDSGKGLDNAVGMAAAGMGQARINKMLEKLEQAVKKDWPLVSQINLAVFGFSRGATTARAFVHQLETKLAYSMGEHLYWKQFNANDKQPEIVVYFMGLMDTVSSTGFGGSSSETAVRFGSAVLSPLLGGFLSAIDDGGHAAWAHDLSIPEYVKLCVHYVAGHEVREKFPSDSVRRDQAMPANCVETVYPGVHSDVGGGYAPAVSTNQEGRNNEYSRIPLCHMFIDAYKAGVPFKEPGVILANAGGLFEITPELERIFDVYMDGAPQNGGRLETSIIWHMNRYYEWRESRRRRLNDGRFKPKGGVDPYMKITDAEWESDVISVAKSQTGYFKTNAYPNEEAMFRAYKHEVVGAMNPPQRSDFDLFFDSYIHDSIAGFKKQMNDAFKPLGMTELSRWSINRKIFMGKRDDKFLYWRYEGWFPWDSGTKVAKLEDSDKTTTV